MARSPSLLLCSLLLLGSTSFVACDGGGEEKVDDRFKVEKKFVPLSERTQKVEQTPEELEEMRKKSGFKTQEEIAAENAAMFEKGDREYVKTRLSDYRAFVGELKKYLDEFEAEAAKWAKASAPDKAYERWEKKFKKATKDYEDRYMKLTGDMTKGGNTTAKLGAAWRAWDELSGSLSGEIANNERFAGAVQEIRDQLVKVEAMLDDIEKDDTLVVNKFHEEGEDEKQDE